ncbi:hypothetical protein ABVK25_008273 [Lepraria finkii]|uniref:Uncharacterized protein n=1 Tax=Lepraria finkii TaxID=1340010 RepID=A0ABR4B3E0_9LECA
MRTLLARCSLAANFRPTFLLLYPVSLLASPIDPTNKSTLSTQNYDVDCYPPASHYPTQALLPRHCEEALLKLFISIPSSANGPTFTRAPGKSNLPDHYLVPRQTTSQECTVSLDLHQPRDAEINMGSFYYEGNRVIENCVVSGTDFNGGEVVMKGAVVGQAVNIYIEHPGLEFVAQGPRNMIDSIHIKHPEPAVIVQDLVSTTDTSALTRRISPEENYSPYCYLRSSHPHLLPLIPSHCEAALNNFRAKIPLSINPIFTRDESKARQLPNYFLVPMKSQDEECALMVDLAIGSRRMDAVIDIYEFVMVANRVVDQCVGKGPFDGGRIAMNGEGPNQVITIRFQNSDYRDVGQDFGGGNGSFLESLHVARVLDAV